MFPSCLIKKVLRRKVWETRDNLRGTHYTSHLMALLPTSKKFSTTPDIKYNSLMSKLLNRAFEAFHDFTIPHSGSQLYLLLDTSSKSLSSSHPGLLMCLWKTPILLLIFRNSSPSTWKTLIHHFPSSTIFSCGKSKIGQDLIQGATWVTHTWIPIPAIALPYMTSWLVVLCPSVNGYGFHGATTNKLASFTPFAASPSLKYYPLFEAYTSIPLKKLVLAPTHSDLNLILAHNNNLCFERSFLPVKSNYIM